jgi:hypothetical protein
MLSLFEFVNIINSQEKLIDFLIQRGVLKNTITCSKCNNNIDLDKKTLIYRCRKRYTVKNIHKKRVLKQCDYSKSAKYGTWFDKSHLDVDTICKIIACFLMLRHPRQDDTQDETGAARATIVDWLITGMCVLGS